jgi:hypothetical protein
MMTVYAKQGSLGSFEHGRNRRQESSTGHAKG